jgi:hypothetical protein
LFEAHDGLKSKLAPASKDAGKIMTGASHLLAGRRAPVSSWIRQGTLYCGIALPAVRSSHPVSPDHPTEPNLLDCRHEMAIVFPGRACRFSVFLEHLGI